MACLLVLQKQGIAGMIQLRKSDDHVNEYRWLFVIIVVQLIADLALKCVIQGKNYHK